MNVAFLIYRRPELTARVFEQIRLARPERLFIVADGPKREEAGDSEKVERTRKIVENIDWPCEVQKNYSDVNIGCRKRVSSGLDWVFRQVEEAIILEDDCLPDPSFFPFCCELLERYRTDGRIMHISGNNFQNRVRRLTCSYYFSKYPYIWGWATWRRAWKRYDVNMCAWPAFRDQELLRGICRNEEELAYWTTAFNGAYEEKIDTWDYGWFFTCWAKSGVAILPSVNLVSNIGFGSQSTHTEGNNLQLAGLPIMPMAFPMRHPLEVVVCERADRIDFRRAFMNDPGVIRRVIRQVRNRYFWGSQLRRLPVIGKAWTQWSRRRTGKDAESA